jgi:hypothetical protein
MFVFCSTARICVGSAPSTESVCTYCSGSTASSLTHTNSSPGSSMQTQITRSSALLIQFLSGTSPSCVVCRGLAGSGGWRTSIN